MPRNPFPKNSRVKLLMCGDPECRCENKYLLGEDGIVTNARGRLIVVKCLQAHAGLMTRIVHFRKETASQHLERLDTPRKVKANATV